MIEVQDFVFIPSSRGSVFPFAAHPENMPLWIPSVLQSRVVGSLKTGSSVVQVIRLAGRTFETVHQVTAYEPCHRIAYASVSGPMDVRGTMEFRAHKRETLVHWVVCGDSRGFLPVADGVIVSMGYRKMHRCLENLKRIFADMSAFEIPVRPAAGARERAERSKLRGGEPHLTQLGEA